MRNTFSLVPVLLLLHACASTSSSPVSHSPDQQTIVILGTNDIHGALAPMSFKTREPEGVPTVSYETGGVAYLASYIKKAREEFGPNLIWLDAGDEFQGTIESNSAHGEPMVKFFNSMGLGAAAIGNHEFDYGPETPENPDRLSSLKARMLEAHYPYLAANIIEKDTGDRPPFPNTYPSILLPVGNLKIGIIGLSTLDTPTTTRPENITSLGFTSLQDATVRESKSLRAQGADIVVITAHSGTECAVGAAPAGDAVRKIADHQGTCEARDEMTRLLTSLPPGTVDAVVAGHTHRIIHHWIAGIPVIEGGASGRYFNLIYLTYDLKEHKIIADRTQIEGPVPVCAQVFANQGDCNGDRPAPKNGRGNLITPTFHGSKITQDAEIETLLEPTFEKTRAIKAEVVGQAARPVEHFRDRESPMGNFVADSVRQAVNADFAIVNSGGIRANWEQGPITYGDIFRTLPFDNAVVKVDVTGKELKTILQVAESGSRGFPPISGLRLKLIDPSFEAPTKDLNGDGKIEPWEVNRLLDVRTADGSKIKDDKHYTLATIDFLTSGGDDFGWPMSQIPKDRFHFGEGGLIRDTVAQSLRKLSKPLNTAEAPLVNPADPRIKFEKPAGKKARRRRHKKS